MLDKVCCCQLTKTCKANSHRNMDTQQKSYSNFEQRQKLMSFVCHRFAKDTSTQIHEHDKYMNV